MGFRELILFQLKNVGKSLGIELYENFQNGKAKGISISKQAYSKARMKMHHEGYISLNNNLLEEYYKSKYKTYNGYRLLGIDGTKIEMPYGEELRKEYGKINNNQEYITAAKAVVVYDLLNELLIDSELREYHLSERKSAIEQFVRIKKDGKQKKDIIIADRGFPSLEVFAKLKLMGYDFLIRYGSQGFLREALPIISGNANDKEIEISLTEGAKRRKNPTIHKILEEGSPEKIKLRILKIELSSGKIEYLITSLLSREEHKIADFKELYNLRWNEETYFNFQKNIMEIENFSGKTVESIKQDYYSRILVGNLHSLILEDAQEEIDEDIRRNNKLKYSKYKINKSISYGLMKGSIRELLTTHNWKKKYRELVQLSKKHRNPVKEGRTFSRKSKGILKYPTNIKRVL